MLRVIRGCRSRLSPSWAGYFGNELSSRLSELHRELFVYGASVIVQLLALVLVPVYLYSHGCTIGTCLAFTASAACLSLSWLPQLHTLIRDPSVGHTRVRPPSYKPSMAPSARVYAYLYNGIFRLIFIIIYVCIYIAVDGRVAWSSMSEAFSNLGSLGGPLLPFWLQLTISPLTYHAARLACMLTMHQFAFAPPLFLTFPFSMALALAWPQMPYIVWVRI